MAEISVIVPTYNRSSVLERALRSVARQSFSDWEILVVDDGSTDDTPAILQKMRETLGDRLRVWRTENRGVSAARNLAAREARGQWLAFLDSDDEWLPEKLSRQMQLSRDFVWLHGEEIWMRNGVRVNAMNRYRKSGGRVFSRCVDLCCVSPSTTMVRRDLFLKSGGFREDFPVCEDYELWLRLAAEHEIGFIEEPVQIKYGGHADQLSRQFKAMDYYRAKALVPFLEDETLTRLERQHVAQTLHKMCEILLKGYAKHGRSENVPDVQTWRFMAKRALTQDPQPTTD